MNYDQAVKEGRRLVQQEGEIRFALGDLALKLVPMGAVGVRDTLESFAEDIGVDFGTLDQYRQIASTWPAAIRMAAASWSVHQTLAAMPNRAELIRPGMKVNEARQLAGRASARGIEETRHGLSQLPSERKAEIARELLQDPEVRRSALSDVHTRAKLTETERDIAGEQEQVVRDRYQEKYPASFRMEEVYGAVGDLSAARRAVGRALDRLRKITLDDAYRQMVQEDIDEVKVAIGWLQSYLDSGDTSFDEELTKLLESES